MNASSPASTLTGRNDSAPLATEPTPEGEQILIPGVKPIALRERLALLLAAPLASRKPQKPLNLGLFDEDARNQLSLF